MTYGTQIEPFPTNMNNYKAEPKRQSLYTCIRNASKLIKIRTEIRKHRTLPSDIDNTKVVTSYNSTATASHYSYQMNASNGDEDSEEETLYDEKDPIANKLYSTRQNTQLALPSKLNFGMLNSQKLIEEDEKASMEEDVNDNEYDDYDDYDDEEYDEGDDEFEDELVEDPYTSTLQKLSGISFKSSRRQNTAVLITLSPCALAAANAARQKRQKIRVTH